MKELSETNSLAFHPQFQWRRKKSFATLIVTRANKNNPEFLGDASVGQIFKCVKSGNTKGGSITIPLMSCLIGLESAV